jgi:polysaccharide chain length determinant protein (PEP-CTERM system associated)
MQELVNQLVAVLRGMWKYRWLAVAAAWVVAAVGVVVVWRIPDQYLASARIYVDTQSILKPLMSGIAVQPNVDQQVTMLSRTLISRPNVEKLVRMADLDLASDSGNDQAERIDALMRTLSIQSTGRDNLYTLSYRHEDAEKSKRVVQSLVSIFIESSLGATRKDADAAKVFLNDQIKTYQTKLEEAEARLKAFRLRNIELQTADGRDWSSRVAELSAQLDKARVELREAEDSRAAARAAMDAEKTQANSTSVNSLLQESAISVSTPEIDARLDAQRRALDALLQRFTDVHPDVTSARRIIADLEQQKKREMQELRKAAAAAATTAPSPVFTSNSLAVQELGRVLATSEVQVAALRGRVAEYSARYNQARNMMKVAPQIEAEEAQLNRDYAIHKKNYEDLVSRRESAAMSGSLEVVSGMADFRLIDPPRVSPTPVFPNRLMLLPLVLAAAVGAGLFVAFATSQLRPVFHRAADLRQKVRLPLLGVVSLMVTDAQRRRERVDLVQFCTASGSLVGVFVVAITAMILTGAV